MRVLATTGAAFVVFVAFMVYEEPSEQRIPARNWEGAVALADVDSVRVRSPATEAEVVQVVSAAARAGSKVKVVGSGHSWARIAAPPPGSILLSTHRLNRPLGHDAERQQVTVQGGMRLRDFADYAATLDPPLALHNYPSVDEQTVAGAIATATHGSGADHVNLGASPSTGTLPAAPRPPSPAPCPQPPWCGASASSTPLAGWWKPPPRATATCSARRRCPWAPSASSQRSPCSACPTTASASASDQSRTRTSCRIGSATCAVASLSRCVLSRPCAGQGGAVGKARRCSHTPLPLLLLVLVASAHRLHHRVFLEPH